MKAKQRVLVAAILHETNTFNRIPSHLADFAGRYLEYGLEAVRARLTNTATEIGGFLDMAEVYGWDLVIPVAGSCGPSGPLASSDWCQLRERLLAAEGEFDGIALALHGAMVTENCLDPEGEILAALRAKYGPHMPIVATLDMHANVSEKMLQNADALFPYQTYPHIDQALRARSAASALQRLMDLAARHRPRGRLTRSIMARPPMLDAADHGRTNPPGPMAGLLQQAARLAEDANVISCGITIGFPWADVAEAGPAVFMSFLETYGAAPTDCTPKPALMELAGAIWRSREQTQLEFSDPASAMAKALEPGDGGPLILADFADNPAAGAYGDSPNLLRAMLAAGLENAAFASIADPACVQQAADAGVGKTINLCLGGRHTPHSTPPLRISAEVLCLHHGEIVCEGPFLQGLKISMGPMALVRSAGVRILIASRALAITDTSIFRAVGLDPAGLQTIALKSRNHFRAAFAAIARDTLLVDAGGIATMRLAQIPYRNVSDELWPLHTSSRSSTQLEYIHVFDTSDEPSH